MYVALKQHYFLNVTARVKRQEAILTTYNSHNMGQSRAKILKHIIIVKEVSMKKVLTNLFFIILFLVCTGCQKKHSQSKDLLSVKKVLTSPKRYLQKEITLAGIVYKIDTKSKKLQLVDLSECISTCDPTSCKVLALPIQYGDIPIPEIGTKVKVTGIISKQNGRFLFVMSKLEQYNEK